MGEGELRVRGRGGEEEREASGNDMCSCGPVTLCSCPECSLQILLKRM